MASFSFYRDIYMGGSISDEVEFLRLEARAREKLARYKRLYRVSAPLENSEDMAICAMVDALNYFDVAQNGGIPTSSSIGSVSSTSKVGDSLDISPKAQERELYRCAALYLDIYRGVG